MNLPSQFKKQVAIDDSRLVLLDHEATIDLSQLGCGILFVLAPWSGASVLAFRALNRALARMRDLHDITVYIADNGSPKTLEFMTGIGDVPAGHGETYWISDGVVRSKLEKYGEDEESLIEDYTRGLT